MKLRLKGKRKLTMKAQLFLTLLVFGLAAAWLPGMAGVFGLSSGQSKVIAGFVVIVCVGGFAYLLAVTLSRGAEQLAEQAQAVVHHPALQEVSIPGTAVSELAAIAAAVNRLKDELTKGEELRNQLVADAAHELRTPVAILRGHLETMVKGAEEPRRESLLPLLDETKRMSRLIQDMRDLNLAEAGRLVLDRTWIPIRDVLEEIVSILQVEAEMKGNHILLEGTGVGELYCDAPRIKQVLINLIGNAIRYTPEGGTIAVQYAVADGRVDMIVKDTGPGIAPEHLPYLFKRFYRIEASRNRMSGGTGLGLAIAKQFIEIHDGTLQAASELGTGTTFTVSLPVYPPNP
jgi:two-component system, OmpR family, sensor histidine kinase BaeS